MGEGGGVVRGGWGGGGGVISPLPKLGVLKQSIKLSYM